MTDSAARPATVVANEGGASSGQNGAAGENAGIIDWSAARRIAEWTAARKAIPTSYRQPPMQKEFDEVVSLAEGLVGQATGFHLTRGPTRARVTDRAGWASANVSSFQRLLTPTIERLEEKRSSGPMAKLGPLNTASRMASAAQLGLILAWLSGRVLGQYDLLLTDEASEDQDVVYFVGPNIVQLENRHGFATHEFRLWLALHEVTHRYQFTAVPWMKGYFLELVDQALEPLTGDPRDFIEALRRVTDQIRARRSPLGEAGALGIVATPEQLKTIQSVQALMSLLEGHADVVMDRAGADVVLGADRFRGVMAQRRSQIKGPAKLVQQLLGIEAKLRQYAEGADFMRAVEDQGGPELFNRVWDGPQWLPSLDEIRAPADWIKRVGQSGPPDQST